MISAFISEAFTENTAGNGIAFAKGVGDPHSPILVLGGQRVEAGHTFTKLDAPLVNVIMLGEQCRVSVNGSPLTPYPERTSFYLTSGMTFAFDRSITVIGMFRDDATKSTFGYGLNKTQVVLSDGVQSGYLVTLPITDYRTSTIETETNLFLNGAIDLTASPAVEVEVFHIIPNGTDASLGTVSHSINKTPLMDVINSHLTTTSISPSIGDSLGVKVKVTGIASGGSVVISGDVIPTQFFGRTIPA